MSQYFDNDKNIKSEKRLIKFNFNNKEFSIYSDNGVFSKDRFDYGTRVICEAVMTTMLLLFSLQEVCKNVDLTGAMLIV